MYFVRLSTDKFSADRTMVRRISFSDLIVFDLNVRCGTYAAPVRPTHTTLTQKAIQFKSSYFVEIRVAKQFVPCLYQISVGRIIIIIESEFSVADHVIVINRRKTIDFPHFGGGEKFIIIIVIIAMDYGGVHVT